MDKLYGKRWRKEEPDSSVAICRVRLMMEELTETIIAIHEGDREKLADGLGDLLYVVFGTALNYNIPIGPVFAEIHKSNMTKDMSHGGDPSQKSAKKNEGFRKPKLSKLLER